MLPLIVSIVVACSSPTPIESYMSVYHPTFSQEKVQKVESWFAVADEYETAKQYKMLLVCIADLESTFNPEAINKTSAILDRCPQGLFQWKPCYHSKFFKDNNLDMKNPQDEVRAMCLKIEQGISNKKTIEKILQPWAVRKKAIKRWKKLQTP